MKNISKFADEILKESALFHSDEELQKYLKKHPEADKSKHRVVKPLGKSENRIKFVNYKERQDALELLKKKMKNLPYKIDDDEHHIHFPNYGDIQKGLEVLKQHGKDKFIEKIHKK